MRQTPPTTDHPGFPRISAERMQGCVQDYGDQLPAGSWAFSPTIKVDQEGNVLSVDVGNMPNTAPDLAACTRIVLGDMAIPPSVFTMRATQSASTNEPTVGQRSLVGNPAVAVVVVVALGELAFEAGAYTILFAVSVEMLAKLSARCRKVKENCIDSCVNSDLPTGTYSGDPYHACLRRCMERAGCF